MQCEQMSPTDRFVLWLVAITGLISLLYLTLPLLLPVKVTPVNIDSAKQLELVVQGAGAVASFAAAFVALWLGLRDKRDRAASDLAKAKLTAAKVVDRVCVLYQVSLGAGFETRIAGGSQDRLKTYKDWFSSQHVAMALDVSDEELLALTPLPGRCAGRLAYCITALKRVRQGALAMQFEIIDNLALKSWRQTVEHSSEILSDVWDQLRQITDEATPMPDRIRQARPGED